jgi:hypothetical protein
LICSEPGNEQLTLTSLQLIWSEPDSVASAKVKKAPAFYD